MKPEEQEAIQKDITELLQSRKNMTDTAKTPLLPEIDKIILKHSPRVKPPSLVNNTED